MIENSSVDERDEPKLSTEEQSDAEDRERVSARVVYETVRREGDKELARPISSLVWSGVAAGVGIGFSLVAEAALHVGLPDTSWRPLVENFGYCVGFLIVILARQQLFTENTITVVLPLLAELTRPNFKAMIRLWTVVFAANMVGTLLFAFALSVEIFFPHGLQQGFREVSSHLMQNAAPEMFFRGIFAGWLIATLVWLLPSAEGAQFWVITLVTYLIALTDLTHVVAGSVEAFFLMFLGDVTPVDAIFTFLLPVLFGNILGGAALFALISYAQVRREI